ncbi:hypothetical protein MATL_G00171680 [Megalops atlanticus]|uniref:Uncharacterized protein n=1 Tax=Megalops atlanticus TaxID=7932 RepID=A0A9D3PR54_MEGAT|nr:hypothetical protein MATL_G00171680 [Megalops atlanticus]
MHKHRSGKRACADVRESGPASARRISGPCQGPACLSTETHSGTGPECSEPPALLQKGAQCWEPPSDCGAEACPGHTASGCQHPHPHPPPEKHSDKARASLHGTLPEHGQLTAWRKHEKPDRASEDPKTQSTEQGQIRADLSGPVASSALTWPRKQHLLSSHRPPPPRSSSVGTGIAAAAGCWECHRELPGGGIGPRERVEGSRHAHRGRDQISSQSKSTCPEVRGEKALASA